MNSFVFEPDIVVFFDPELIHKKVNVADHPDMLSVLNSERKDVLESYSEIGFRSIYLCDSTQYTTDILVGLFQIVPC